MFKPFSKLRVAGKTFEVKDAAARDSVAAIEDELLVIHDNVNNNTVDISDVNNHLLAVEKEVNEKVLNVIIESDGFGHFTADYNDNDIINFRNNGGVVQARYYDSLVQETYTFYFSKIADDRRALFTRTYIENGIGKQVIIKIGFDKSVEIETKVTATPGVSKEYVDNTFASVIKNKASGSVITLNDVSAIPHICPTKVESTNIIPYPYAETTKTENGITFTDNGDGTITVNGTATEITFFYLLRRSISEQLSIEKDTTISASLTESSPSTYELQVYGGIDDDNYAITTDRQPTSSKNFTAQWIRIIIRKGYTANNLVFKPMLNKGTEALPYTPYVSDLTSGEVITRGDNMNKKIELGGLNIITGLPDNNLNRTRSDFIKVEPNTTYSIQRTVGEIRWVLGYDKDKKLVTDSSNGGYVGALISFPNSVNKSPFRTSLTTEWIRWYDTNSTDIAEEVMINKGDYKPYEPYKGKTYKPLADGTVENVQSISPNMTLIGSEGIVVDTEYNADTKLYIDKKIKDCCVPEPPAVTIPLMTENQINDKGGKEDELRK